MHVQNSSLNLKQKKKKKKKRYNLFYYAQLLSTLIECHVKDRKDLQARDHNIEHSSERLASICNILVNNNTSEPNKQSPRQKKDTMH